METAPGAGIGSPPPVRATRGGQFRANVVQPWYQGVPVGATAPM